MKTFLKFYLHSSTLLARIGSNDIAESMMTFNTNYKDVGLFGVYAIAKVFICHILFSDISQLS